MAKVYETKMLDDLSGDPADETVTFGIDGKELSIDLTAANATRLRDSLAEFVAVARRASGGGRPARRATSTADRNLNQDMRQFAHRRGMKCAERGRIPAEVQEAYRAERGDTAVAS